ncbi:MAG: S41 family peptidase [Dehalococcoidales bacterium]|nr:S41 family peptidase [Dehalococcoidales bacterium]
MTKKMRTALISLCIIIALGLSFIGGCTLDIFKPASNSNTTQNTNQELNLKLLEEAYQIILKEYVEPDKIDTQKMNEGILKGLVQGLNDPYSAYLTQEQYAMSVSDFAGQFEGIGAYVGSENGRVTVIAPIPDTPAAEAGIKSGDIILEVDGKTTIDMSVTEVVLLIRGPKGTPVKLTVLHKDDAEPVTLEIIRAEIKIPSVTLEMKGDYAHITITNFTERTDDELVSVLKTISDNKAKGIVLDLRSNPGGLLSTVIQVASHFLDKGVVVSVVYPDSSKDSDSVNPLAYKTSLPMVVLVDHYSASASEILAGALQDYKRALIAGEKTYGKGSVNQLLKLSDGSGIYITIARWVTPNGNLIEGNGIQPDTELDFETVDGVQWAIDYLLSEK